MGTVIFPLALIKGQVDDSSLTFNTKKHEFFIFKKK